MGELDRLGILRQIAARHDDRIRGKILQRLLGKDENAEDLLKTALECAGKRVVVKRPIHAETVGDCKPDTSISSKKTRYDVYLVNR